MKAWNKLFIDQGRTTLYRLLRYNVNTDLNCVLDRLSVTTHIKRLTF